MKSFADFDEYKNFKEDLLLEYSIHDNKYGAGEKVVVKPPEVDTISNYLDAKIDSSTIFIKVGAIPNAIEVKVGKGSGSEVYLQIEGKPEKTWVLRGSGETIKNYFNGYKDGTGISWKADSIETAQCLGLYFDADSALKKIGKSGGTPSRTDQKLRRWRL